jgi:hypothetical protein
MTGHIKLLFEKRSQEIGERGVKKKRKKKTPSGK